MTRRDDTSACQELCPEVEEVHAAVFGNGAPENCILVRLAVIEKKIKTVERLSWMLLCGVGSLIGRWLLT